MIIYAILMPLYSKFATHTCSTIMVRRDVKSFRGSRPMFHFNSTIHTGGATEIVTGINRIVALIRNAFKKQGFTRTNCGTPCPGHPGIIPNQSIQYAFFRIIKTNSGSRSSITEHPTTSQLKGYGKRIKTKFKVAVHFKDACTIITDRFNNVVPCLFDNSKGQSISCCIANQLSSINGRSNNTSQVPVQQAISNISFGTGKTYFYASVSFANGALTSYIELFKHIGNIYSKDLIQKFRTAILYGLNPIAATTIYNGCTKNKI